MKVVRAIHWRRIRHSPLVHNAVSLSGMQLAGYIAPLVTLPYLARILGPSHWGSVALAQAFGLYTTIVVEFGFALSGTREIARHRGDPEKIGEIFIGVIGAKTILSLLCLLTASAVVAWVPQFSGNRVAMFAGALAGIAQGFNVGWFYLGLERMRVVSIVDISSKALFATSVFIFIHSPKDDWLVLCLQCFWYSASALFLLANVYREFPICKLTIRNATETLKAATAIFLYKGTITLYTTANTLVLGLFTAPVSVAYYAAAEKINNVLVNTTIPITQTIYPRMNHLMVHDPRQAEQLGRYTLLFSACLGCVLSLASYVCAPFGVRLFLGKGYETVVPVLRILSLSLPLVICNLTLGYQFMLPRGLDKQLNVITVMAGIVNITALAILVPRYAHLGVAWTVILTESLILIALSATVLRHAPNFISSGPDAVKVEIAG